MNPGSTYPPRASTTVSCLSAIDGAIAVMRPSRIDTSPSMTSKRSFMVRTIPPRTSSDTSGLLFERGELGRRPAKRGGVVFAVLDGNQLRKNADRDFLRRDGADVEADRRVHACEQLGRHLIRHERVVTARNLRAAADETEIAELPRRERAHRLEIVRVPARHDDRVRVRRKVRARDPRRDVVDDDLDGIGKALAVRELLAVVDDVDAETDF